MRAEIGVWSRPEDHTVARRERRISLIKSVCHSERPYREESAFRFSLAALPPPLPNSHCGNHLEILWEALIDGIFAALYVYQVSRTVGSVVRALARIPKIRLD